MAGVLGIYGLIVAVIIIGGSEFVFLFFIWNLLYYFQIVYLHQLLRPISCHESILVLIVQKVCLFPRLLLPTVGQPQGPQSAGLPPLNTYGAFDGQVNFPHTSTFILLFRRHCRTRIWPLALLVVPKLCSPRCWPLLWSEWTWRWLRHRNCWWCWCSCCWTAGKTVCWDDFNSHFRGGFGSLRSHRCPYPFPKEGILSMHLNK